MVLCEGCNKLVKPNPWNREFRAIGRAYDIWWAFRLVSAKQKRVVARSNGNQESLEVGGLFGRDSSGGSKVAI